MVVEKIHERISYKQSKWLENYFSFNTKKQIRARIDFEKDFYKLLVDAAFGRMSEKSRNCLRLELFKKDEKKDTFKEQSKLTFIGIRHSYENCYSYTFKQNELLMGKPIYVGFNFLEVSKLHKIET